MIKNRNKLIESFEKETNKYYSNEYLNYNKKWKNHLIPEIHKFIQILGNAGKIILDAGSGIGRDSIYFNKLEYEIIGADLSCEMTRQSMYNCVEVNAYINLNIMDVKSCSFKDKSFDGIWCCAVLLHIPPEYTTHIIKEFKRILKTNGILFISTKNLFNLNNLFRSIMQFIRQRIKKEPWIFGEAISKDNRYSYFLSNSRLKKMLLKNGFKIIYSSNATSYWINIWAIKI